MKRTIQARRSLCFVMVLSICSVVVSGCCGGPRERRPGASGPTGGAKAAPSPAPAPVQEQALNTPAAIGDFEVTVHGSSTKAITTRGLAKHKARAGATLRFIEVTVKNNGDRPKVLATHFWLEDATKRRFDPTPVCQLATPDSIGRLDQFNPGLARRGRMCFEIPAEATGLRFMFRDGFRKAVPFRLE